MYIPSAALLTQPQPLWSTAHGDWSNAQGYQDPNWIETFNLDPVALTGGFRILYTSPVMLCGAGIANWILTSAMTPAFISVENLPFSTDGFDLIVELVVSNNTGTQLARLDNQLTTLAPGVTSGAVNMTGFTYNHDIGTDINMVDDGGGSFVVYSTAGGLFQTAFTLVGTYN